MSSARNSLTLVPERQQRTNSRIVWRRDQAITTASPQAQAYFDQGLRLVYAATFGLAQSLRAQGKTEDAAVTEARFQKAWALADVTLSASRF
jgi:hypothetical protein